MKNGSEKAKIANDLFGRSGAELAPIIQGNADTINNLKKRANELGLVMSDELVNNCVEFGDLMDDVKKSASMLGAGIASALMPSII
jgi:mannose/fructose/N-acetylgalactosamine-specific phosphotransferase system component IID